MNFNSLEFTEKMKNRIHSKVNERGLNMHKLTKQLDLSYTGFLSMIENGSYRLSTIIQICNALDTPIEYFIGEYLKEISPGGDAKATVHGNNNTLRNVGVSRSVIVDEGRKIEDLEERMKYLQKSLETMEKLVALLEKQLEENKKKG